MNGLTKLAATISLTVGAVTLAGCGGSTNTETSKAAATTPPVVTTTTRTSTPVPAPAPVTPATYELREDGKKLTMLVTTDDTVAIGPAFKQIADNFIATRPNGGYHVMIDCAIDYDPTKPANRLGVGKIAVGQLGAAQTGLSAAGMSTVAWNTGRTCQPGFVEPTFDSYRQLDGPYALELCRGRVEDEYIADQRPVNIVADPVKTATGWLVAGTAQGKGRAGMDMAVMRFSCTVSDAGGTLTSSLDQFDS
ncbi:hypothetical protein ACFWU5_16615 [Nocardia sp. NPDC058640]|uniref:hypothetical protein n=1 Tax=Nocardia sp. NPDC058640 TaxID=3346571 RepID=UPI0036545026